MTKNAERPKPPAFFASEEFAESRNKSFVRHTASPEISLDSHLISKDLELKKAIATKKIIYLDTNHWVNLRHVVLKSPLQKTVYGEMFELLVGLKGKGKICCPISFLLFLELIKQNDQKTLIETAKLMDRLSDGVCFLFPLEMARNELRHFLLGLIPNLDIGSKAWVWTKIGFIAGHVFPELLEIPSKTNVLMQKAWTDFMWNISLEQFLSVGVGPISQGADYWKHYAAASNTDAVFYRSSNLDYDEVLQREKALLLRPLIRDELALVSQEIVKSHPAFADQKSLLQAKYSPRHFPSAEVLARINAASMLSKMKFEANDMLDFRHAAVAIPYCDAICCDNPMATQLRNKPCELQRIYGTAIFGRTEEINAYLKTLNT